MTVSCLADGVLGEVGCFGFGFKDFDGFLYFLHRQGQDDGHFYHASCLLQVDFTSLGRRQTYPDQATFTAKALR
jgi:hypothetical protein